MTRSTPERVICKHCKMKRMSRVMEIIDGFWYCARSTVYYDYGFIKCYDKHLESCVGELRLEIENLEKEIELRS